MKPIRWTDHALQNLAAREIDRSEADETIARPKFVIPDPPDRQILMRRYSDPVLNQDMLLRVVVEETASEIVVVTVYKSSQFSRCLKGLVE
jgi:hypothetical protein